MPNMANNNDKYTDKSGDKKYFAMIPYYIVNHSSHYEQSLYLVMKRLASEYGTCWASAATLGKMMSDPESKEKVSANTVRKYREKLIKRGWIRKVGRKGKTKPADEFEIVDLWELNMKFYNKKESSTSEQSQKESSTSEKIVHPVSLVSSQGDYKEETIKKKQEEYNLREQSSQDKPHLKHLIPDIIKAFESINPAAKQFYSQPPQRKAAMELLEFFGFERLLGVIENTLPKTNALAYFPTITTPIQLRDKWAQLEAAVKKERSKLKARGRGIA
jgi:hypothetical protein